MNFDTETATTSVEKSAIRPAVGDGLKGPAQKEGRGTKARSRCLSTETPERQAKARAFWQRLYARRHQPGHCTRCGRPWTGPTKTCDHCRDYHSRNNAEKRNTRLTLPEVRDQFAMILRRVASLEISVARLQTSGREAYQRGYRIGNRHGAQGRARAYEGLRGEHAEHRRGEKASVEELSQLDHGYQNVFDNPGAGE